MASSNVREDDSFMAGPAKYANGLRQVKEPVTTRPPLTFTEKLTLPLRLLLSGPVLCFNLTRCISIAWWRGLPLKYFATCAVIRTMLCSFTPHQLQLLQGGSITSYRTWIAWARSSVLTGPKDPRPEKRLKEDIEVLPDGESSLMWIGDRHRATRVVLYVHGGGFAMPISWAQMEWCLRALVQASSDDDEVQVAVACLQYSLAPNLRFPGQIRQAVDALNHLLRSGHEAGDIVLGGDSSGGNVTFQVLAHMLNPRPGIAPVNHSGKPLLGAFAVSPWLGNSAGTPAWQENDAIDAIGTRMLMDFGRAYVNGERAKCQGWGGNSWAFPYEADHDGSWLDGLQKVASSLYVTTGKHEILRDDIVLYTEAVRKRNSEGEVILRVFEKLGHSFLIVDGMSKSFGEATEDMKSWFLQRLSS